MSELSSIISVSISRQSAAVTRAGFGVPLIAGPNGVFSGVRSYANLSAVGEDFSESSDEYKMASALFSQALSVPTIKIGKVALVAGVLTVSLEGTATAGSMELTVNAQSVGPVAFNTDNDTSLDDVATAIAALDDVDTAVASNGAAGTDVDPHTITITFNDGYLAAASVDTDFTGITASAVAETTPAETFASSLASFALADPDFYFVLSTSTSEVDVIRCAVWTEANARVFVTRSNDANVKSAVSTTDIAYLLSNASYTRSSVVYHGTAGEYPDAAWVGLCAPSDPGSITWAYKQLTGISADSLTQTEINAVHGKNANTFITLGGVNVVQFGTVASGEFIDNIRGSDWLSARIQEGVYSNMVNLPKIPFTNQGIAVVENVIRSVLQEGVASGFLAANPAFTVSVPDAIDVSSANKLARTPPAVTFEATVAGAIHKVVIQGVVKV